MTVQAAGPSVPSFPDSGVLMELQESPTKACAELDKGLQNVISSPTVLSCVSRSISHNCTALKRAIASE